MKKAIPFILMFLVLLTVVGCTDHEKDPSVEESTSVTEETEKTLVSSNVPVNKDTENADQTNDYSNQPVASTVAEKKPKSTTVSQGMTDAPEKTQPTNDTRTNQPDQANSTTATESSSSSGTQSTPITDNPPSATSNEGVDLPIDTFD